MAQDSKTKELETEFMNIQKQIEEALVETRKLAEEKTEKLNRLVKNGKD